MDYSDPTRMLFDNRLMIEDYGGIWRRSYIHRCEDTEGRRKSHNRLIHESAF